MSSLSADEAEAFFARVAQFNRGLDQATSRISQIIAAGGPDSSLDVQLFHETHATLRTENAKEYKESRHAISTEIDRMLGASRQPWLPPVDAALLGDPDAPLPSRAALSKDVRCYSAAGAVHVGGISVKTPCSGTQVRTDFRKNVIRVVNASKGRTLAIVCKDGKDLRRWFDALCAD